MIPLGEKTRRGRVKAGLIREPARQVQGGRQARVGDGRRDEDPSDRRLLHRANAKGYVPYATRRDPDVLKVNRGHEPD